MKHSHITTAEIYLFLKKKLEKKKEKETSFLPRTKVGAIIIWLNTKLTKMSGKMGGQFGLQAQPPTSLETLIIFFDKVENI